MTLTAGNRYGESDALSLRVLLQVNGQNVNSSFINNGKLLQHITANNRRRSICNKVGISVEVTL